ncbi:UNVERIFIED_CONTAM: hypothetical protein GTU68_064550 [Idotea baltica]|nr:hypothetical protein [Idotea baltica]
MIRTFIAAAAATVLLTACTNSQSPDIQTPEERAAAVSETFEKHLPWNSDAENVKQGLGGLEYVVLKEGKADGKSPTAADTVMVHYEGRLPTGEQFDSSFERQEPAVFPSNGVIAGWVEALQIMKPGDRWLVYVPSDLAYGPEGRPGIPPNAPLMFEVELLDVM